MVLYLRNNALKSHYPLRKGRLFAEFIILFLGCLGLCTFIPNMLTALRQKEKQVGAPVNLRKEVTIYNLAHHFIPFEYDNFSSDQNCDSLKARAARKTAGPARKIPEADTIQPEYSYLHYCEDGISLRSDTALPDAFQQGLIVKRWLLNRQKDSVSWVIREYLKLCNKYGISYRFDPEQQAAAVFQTSRFLVIKEINSYPDKDGNPYINAGLENKLYGLDQQRVDTWWDKLAVIALLYLSLGAALIIFSFRLTHIRTWFLALVTTGILALVFSISTAVIRYPDDWIVEAAIYITIIASFIVALQLIRKRTMRQVAGIALICFIWSFPFLIPGILNLLADRSLRSGRLYELGEIQTYTNDKPPYIYEWVHTHEDLIHGLNVVFIILMAAFVIIPLARRWQANPEE
jgi:hypothetical protein